MGGAQANLLGIPAWATKVEFKGVGFLSPYTRTKITIFDIVNDMNPVLPLCSIDLPVNDERTVCLLPAKKMNETHYPGWDSEKPRKTCWDGRQQAHNEPFYDGGLSIVSIPVFLCLISYDAQCDPHQCGEQHACSQGRNISSEEHCIDNDG